MQSAGGTDFRATGEELYFEAYILDQCFHSTIDMSTSGVPSTTVNYLLHESQHTESFALKSTQILADDGVTVLTTCADITYTLAMQDGQAIDSDVFTYEGNGNGKLHIYSTDPTKAGSYDLRITADMGTLGTYDYP